MSRENVEVVRRLYAAVADHDASRVRALYHPEVEVDVSRLPEARLVGEGVSRGYEGIRSTFRDWSEAWQSFEDHCDELIDAGDYVVSLVTRRGRGRTSGVETATPRAGVWTVRDGKVTRIVWFPTHDEALEAVGLREKAMSRENVEIVRRLYAGWERGDFAAELDSYDPEVELVIDYGPDRTTASGFDEMRRTWREQLTLWDSWSTGPIEEVVEGDAEVVVRHSLRARSKRGLSVDSAGAGCAFTFRDGRIVRIVATDDFRKALEVAGLASPL